MDNALSVRGMKPSQKRQPSTCFPDAAPARNVFGIRLLDGVPAWGVLQNAASWRRSRVCSLKIRPRASTPALKCVQDIFPPSLCQARACCKKLSQVIEKRWRGSKRHDVKLLPATLLKRIKRIFLLVDCELLCFPVIPSRLSLCAPAALSAKGVSVEAAAMG